MDWQSDWEPLSYIEIELVDPAADPGRLADWLVLIVIALAAVLIWQRHRVRHRSFWCAIAARDVEVRFRRGCVLSCSAFEDPTTIACSRRCLNRSFHEQWPPALPVLTRC